MEEQHHANDYSPNVGFEEEVRNLKLQLEEKNEEIISLRQREIQNEDYSSRLARKLDRLMVENQNKAQKDLRMLLVIRFQIKCKACDDESVAKWSCKECKENICDLCYKAHIRVKLTKHHVLSEL